MKTHFLKSLLSVILLAFNLPASAADIDLYINSSATASSDLPNVLFIVDNTANWSTPFTDEISALATTFRNLPVNNDGSAKFNIGIMFSAETGSPNNNVSGGYVRAAMRPMNATNKLIYQALINSLDSNGDKGNGGASGVTMAEAYFYFKGLAPYAGNNKAKTDYTGNTYGTSQSRAIYALPGNALASVGATTYLSPVVAGSCSKNYIIYISNGANQENSSADTTANSLLTAAGGDATQINLTPSGSQGNPSDEWARLMHNSSLGTTTFAIDVNPGTTGQGPGWSALLKSMSAGVGGGTYTAVSSTGGAQISNAINDALSKIQSVNSVFAAVSLPASASIQGAFLNQIYIGMFRPDANVQPRWMGNLKQYKLGTDLHTVDADGAAAIDSGTGFISACARSYWTPPTSSPDSYWSAYKQGTCIPPGSNPDLYSQSNTPDGNIVEKGAEAYRLRNESSTTRIVKTCSATFASCTTLTNFDNTTVTTANLGAASSTERDLLINWARGQNVDAELGKTTTEMRPSSHGDVIHSNPFALSYGSDVVVFYGGNDGMFRAVNGNQSGNIGSVPPGGELWAFMPPEFYGSIKRLRDNNVLVSTAPYTATDTLPKPYSIDGPVAAYQDASHAWMYAAMRRGGRALYAFDVTTPTSPSLLWKKGCPDLTDDTNCTAGFSGIGQTWSMPQPVKVAGQASPVIIIGGGYDNCEDSDPNTCGAASKGNKIFVLDAASGALLQTFNTDRSVVGDVKVGADANGLAIYAYAADLGGNIYRITIGAAAPGSWPNITKIASLGCPTPATCTNNRKFMFAASVTPQTDGSYSLFIGTGDREKPLPASYYPNANSVTNYFFRVNDKPADSNWLHSEAQNCGGMDVICMNSLTLESSAATCGTTNSAALSSKGWIFGLRPTEQVVTKAATRFGVTTFSTHMPATPTAGQCGANLGTTHVYNLNVQDASPASGTTCNDTVSGGGLPPSAEKLDVCMNADCTNKQSICIGCGTASPIDGGAAGSSSFSPGAHGKRRVYWYIQK